MHIDNKIISKLLIEAIDRKFKEDIKKELENMNISNGILMTHHNEKLKKKLKKIWSDDSVEEINLEETVSALIEYIDHMESNYEVSLGSRIKEYYNFVRNQSQVFYEYMRS